VRHSPSDQVFDLTLFFDLSADLLCIAGYDGYFKKVSPSVQKLLGYTQEELFSRQITSFIHPEDRELTDKYRESIKNGSPLYHFENRYLTKTGDIVWLSWTSMPVPDKRLIYAIAKHITHKKKIEADRNLLLTNLTQVNARLKRLNYTTSHDLRAPVNNLLAVFELLDPDKIQDQETRQFIDLLRTSTDVLMHNLNKYVDQLSHPDHLNIQLESLNLELCLQTVLASLASLLESAQASIQVDFSALPEIVFNRAYLESIFLNLITNSIKYAQPGLLPVISISSRLADDVPQLIFSDNGLGFELEKVKDKLFGFHQTFHNHFDSKGIGLYLVHSHLLSLGGQIELESQVNQGSTFTLSFKKPPKTPAASLNP